MLWKMDTFSNRKLQEVTRSKHDSYALDLLEKSTTTTEMDGVCRYATPLLRVPNHPPLATTTRAVLPLLCGTERHLVKNPELVEVRNRAIHVTAGYVTKVTAHEEGNSLSESWYLPHHVIHQHGGKYRLVFNFSFQAAGQSLNDCLLPRPTLQPSFLARCPSPVPAALHSQQWRHQSHVSSDSSDAFRHYTAPVHVVRYGTRRRCHNL